MIKNYTSWTRLKDIAAHKAAKKKRAARAKRKHARHIKKMNWR